jgi:long-chain acyl-CoA synthetase
VIARSPFIAQSFVYGDSLQSQLVAIVVLDPEHMEAWAKKSKVTAGTDMAAWCADPKVKAVVMDEIIKASKQADLKSFEVPRNVFLEANMFTAENGLLTPTFKLKRPVARDFYRDQIDALYAELGASKM